MSRRSLLDRLTGPGTLAAVLVLYFAIPVDPRPSAARLVVGLVLTLPALGWVALVIIREARHAISGAGGGLRGRHLALLVELALVLFALTYYLLAVHGTGQMVGVETRLDALYFTASTIATVGYGDVHPVGQLARGVATAHLVFDVVVLAAAAQLVARSLRERPPGERRVSPSLRLPPPLALKAALAALAPVLVLALVTAWLVGPLGVVWFVLGVAAALPVATHQVSWSVRLATGALLVVAAVGGLLAQGSPVLAALVVAVVSLLQAPVSRQCPGGGAMVPVLAAVAASAGLPDHRATTALAVVVGAVTVAATASVLGLRAPVVPVDAALAWRHAVALALTASLALALLVQREVTHAYWVVLALSLVLRPASEETRSLARDRVVGTVLGLAIGVLAVVLLPLPLLRGPRRCVRGAHRRLGDGRRQPARDDVRRPDAGAAGVLRPCRHGCGARGGADGLHRRWGAAGGGHGRGAGRSRPRGQHGPPPGRAP